MNEWEVERLEKSHHRGDFCCGKNSLDHFLQQLVGQYERRKLGRTFVAVRSGEKRVLGYYTLASSCVSFQNLPEKASRRLPRHPVPVVLLARLAIDQTVQGLGLGKRLLTDALRRCFDLSDTLGIYAVEVEAIDVGARQFYEQFGFVPLEDDPCHLYLPIKTIEHGLA